MPIQMPLDARYKARVIAHYLPQFHPIPENDKWWGKGFTEWTNVTAARPQFRGHEQPKLPADLGFYDLRVAETRAAQADLARGYGVEGFCYWHYWFAGDRLLERPFAEVLASGEPDFPFCLGWANHSWSAAAFRTGNERDILKEQTYPGNADHDRHFGYLLTAFQDPRYIRVDGRPLLLIYHPQDIPDCRTMLDRWRAAAASADLGGLHVVATLGHDQREWDAAAAGFDAATVWPMSRVVSQGRPALLGVRVRKRLERLRLHGLAGRLTDFWTANDRVYDYAQVLDLLAAEDLPGLLCYPMVIPNWDTTPRYAERAIVFHGACPDLFRQHVRHAVTYVQRLPPGRRIIFAKSWNEWAEGNYLEPDRQHGLGFLEALRDEVTVGPV